MTKLNWSLSKVFGFYVAFLTFAIAFVITDTTKIFPMVMTVIPSLSTLFLVKNLTQGSDKVSPHVHWTPGKIFAFTVTTALAYFVYKYQNPDYFIYGVPTMVTYFVSKAVANRVKSDDSD